MELLLTPGRKKKIVGGRGIFPHGSGLFNDRSEGKGQRGRGYGKGCMLLLSMQAFFFLSLFS